MMKWSRSDNGEMRDIVIVVLGKVMESFQLWHFPGAAQTSFC